MPRRSSRTQRLVGLVAALKRNEYPNATVLCGALNRHGMGPVCTKTIHRDIDFLRVHRGAPVDYDDVRHGYHLSDPDWYLPYVELRGNELFASLLCGQLSQPLLPDPLRSAADSAMATQLAAGDPEGCDLDLIQAVILATGARIHLDQERFETVMQGWRDCRRVRITYRRQDGTASRRDLDIHGLFLSDGAWYARAYCHLRHEVRSLALHRIQSAKLLSDTFERDRSIIAELHAGRVFDYPQVRNVRVRANADVALVIREREWFPGQELMSLSGGSIELSWPVVSRPLLFRWILTYGGSLTVLAPQELRDEIARAGERLAEAHGSSPL